MISEEKKKIVVRNYFSIDCDVDTTIREAYELGFDRGIQKAAPVVRRDVLKQVLEIIDKTYGEYARHLPIEEFGRGSYLTGQIKDAVLALKGGEQE